MIGFRTMDAEKAGTGTFYLTAILVVLTVVLVILGVVTIGLVYWVWRYPTPAQAPELGGGTIPIWAITILLGVCLILAAGLQLLVAYLIRGRLRKAFKNSTAKLVVLEQDFNELTEVRNRLQADLKSAEEAIGVARKAEREAAGKVGDLDRQIKDLKAQNLGIDNSLKLAETKLDRWEWLIGIAEPQISRIRDYVKLDYISLGDMELTGSDPTVRFGIHITNNSHLDISLDYEQEAFIHGPIQFTNHKTITLRGTKVVLHTAKDIPSGGSGCLTIEQRLIDNEPRIIAEGKGWPPAMFHFAGLIVNIVGGKQSPDVTRQELEMGNATCSAFNQNLKEKGQRIRALAEVRGSAVELRRVLDIGDTPLPKEILERWEADSKNELKKVYGDVELTRLWEHLSDRTPIPGTAASQRSWLETRFLNMGAFLVDLTGEYGQK